MTVKTLEEALKDTIHGDVHFDEISRNIYSVDASIYEIKPLGIVLPVSVQDLHQTIYIANQYQVPIIPRGAATGITGGCLGQGLVIDTSKYLNHILEFDAQNETVTCEPGVVQDHLNQFLAPKGYRLGPDTSTGNRATLGGMLANNSAGARSLRYGKMVDHIHAVELILANGERITLQEVDWPTFQQKMALQTQEGEIYRTIHHIRETYADEISKRFPNIPRRVSGYNLDELLKPFPLNLSKIIAGSEGTLGICSKITMKVSKKPVHTSLYALFFPDLASALTPIATFLKHQPLALELIDQHILEACRKIPSLQDVAASIPAETQAILLVEFDGDTPEILKAKLDAFQSEISTPSKLLTDPKEMASFWELRKAGLGLLLSKRSYSRAIAFIEDISVPPDQLLPFLQKLIQYLKEQGKEAGIYGHVGAGCMHIRPYIDLRDPKELQHMQTIVAAVSDLILAHGGAMTGEHGDGIVRSWLHPKMFGEKIVQAFEQLKRSFDPHLRMNPHKIVFPAPFLENLRLDPQTPIIEQKTFLNFSQEGGFELAVDMCNGNGRCRKSEGTMCPSFQATQDEYDSTRARAQTLRSMIHERLTPTDLAHEGIHQVLDLCLECKACKTECPSQVDMAKMKAETTYHYQKKNGLSWRSYLFGHIGTLNYLLSFIPKLANWSLKQNWFKSVQRRMGIAEERPLPALNGQRLSEWFHTYHQPPFCQRQVALFNDTFTEFNQESVGISAIKVLNGLGFRVLLTHWKCCGRPLISKGMLEEARQKADILIDGLYPFAKKGIPIVGLEPSCLLSIKDDFPSLTTSKQEKLKEIIEHCVTFDEFMEECIPLFPPLVHPVNASVKLHIHCHQKSLVGVKPTLEVLKSLPGLQVELIQAGCCGMAGSFGYEKEHYELSMKIGELHLFPAVRQMKPGDYVIANGFSCQAQIHQGTGKQALHLAQFLAEIFAHA